MFLSIIVILEIMTILSLIKLKPFALFTARTFHINFKLFDFLFDFHFRILYNFLFMILIFINFLIPSHLCFINFLTLCS